MPLKKPSTHQQAHLPFNSRPPLQLPNEKQDDQTSALIELLLDAAEAISNGSLTKIQMEDEDASEADR
jgi:hypothetical protein